MMKSGTRKANTMSLYVELFKSDTGDSVLKDLIKSTYFLNTTHVAGDPYSTAFNEGQRALVARILRTANINYGKLTQMMEQINTEAQHGQ
jgi:hypothetical protein